MIKVYLILSEKTCGDCWAFRICGLSRNLQCMANDKFRETCQSSLFKENGESQGMEETTNGI